MKRDIDLVRIVLIEIEENGMVRRSAFDERFSDYPQDLVMSHLALLIEAGLVKKALPVELGGAFLDFPISLTWEGYDFLDLARNDTVWAEAKDKMLNHTGGLTIELLKNVLSGLLKQQLGI